MKKTPIFLILFFVIHLIANSQNKGLIVNLNDAKKAVKEYYAM
jgi:hypothetical protein